MLDVMHAVANNFGSANQRRATNDSPAYMLQTMHLPRCVSLALSDSYIPVIKARSQRARVKATYLADQVKTNQEGARVQ